MKKNTLVFLLSSFLLLMISACSESTETESGNVPTKPANIFASDGMFNDRVEVSWTDAAFAETKQVFRAETADGNYEKIAEVTENLYKDTTATIDKKYYYKVKGVNQHGESEFSDIDSGFRTELHASRGTYEDRIEVTWGNIAGADKYILYREDDINGASFFTDEDIIYEGNESIYTDTEESLLRGKSYYYGVKAIFGTDSTYLTQPIEAFKKLVTPANFTASQAKYSKAIDIQWTRSKFAKKYIVERYDVSGDSLDMTFELEPEDTLYNDTASIDPGIIYKYSIYSKKYEATSDLAESNNGYAFRFKASENEYDSLIVLNWDPISIASEYHVYFGDEFDEVDSLTSLPSTETSYIDDGSHIVGIYPGFKQGLDYFYSIRVKHNDDTYSDISVPIRGFTKLRTPEIEAEKGGSEDIQIDFGPAYNDTCWNQIVIDKFIAVDGLDTLSGPIGSFGYDEFVNNKTTSDDTTAALGAVTFYKMIYVKRGFESDSSNVDFGFAQEASGSNNEFSDKIELQWYPVNHELMSNFTVCDRYYIKKDNAVIDSIDYNGEEIMTYTDTDVIPGESYNYKVYSRYTQEFATQYNSLTGNEIGDMYTEEYSFSSLATVPTVTVAPTATNNLENRIRISWDDTVPVSTGYCLYKAETAGGEYLDSVFVDSSDSLHFEDINDGDLGELIPGRTYYYKVKAYKNLSGSSYLGGASPETSGSATAK